MAVIIGKFLLAGLRVVCWDDSSMLEVQLLQASQLLLLEGDRAGWGRRPSTFWWFPSWVRHLVLGLSVPSSSPGYPI